MEGKILELVNSREFQSLSDEPLYNKMTSSEYTHKDAEALKILEKKKK